MDYKQDVIDKTDLTEDQVENIFTVGVDKNGFDAKTIHEICLKKLPGVFEQFKEQLIIQTIDLYRVYNPNRSEQAEGMERN
jgi:hypothetical protein